MAHILGKALQQAVHGHVGAFLVGHVQHNAAVVHHQCAVAQSQRVVHVVGDHQAGDVVFGNNFFGQFQHLFSGAGVQRGGVLIQQQQLGRDQRRHQQGQRLALAARKQADRLFHTVLKAKTQGGKLLGKDFTVLFGDAGERRCVPRRAQVRQREVFLDRHMGRGAAQRVLEHAADVLGAAVVRHKGDVLPVQRNGAGVGDELARNGVEHRGFARAVGADDRSKVAILQVKVDLLQGQLFVDGAGVKGLADIFQFKHGGHLLSQRGSDGGGTPRGTGWRGPRWPAPR